MKITKAVITAAGFGTRMLPASKNVPKEMLCVVDKPAIHYIVQEVVDSGVSDILIVTSRGKDVMENYFDYNPELENRMLAAGKDEQVAEIRKIADMANIMFVRQKEVKGFGHAVWCAKSFIGGDSFAVLSGDDIFMANTPVTKQLIDAAEKHGANTVGVKEVSNADIGKYCTTDIKQLEKDLFEVFKLIEKPKPEQIMSNYAVLGRYVLSKEIFPILENIPKGIGGEIQLTDGLNRLCQVEKMLAVAFEGVRYDTGNVKGYLQATIEIALRNPEIAEWLREYIKTLG